MYSQGSGIEEVSQAIPVHRPLGSDQRIPAAIDPPSVRRSRVRTFPFSKHAGQSTGTAATLTAEVSTSSQVNRSLRCADVGARMRQSKRRPRGAGA